MRTGRNRGPPTKVNAELDVIPTASRRAATGNGRVRAAFVLSALLISPALAKQAPAPFDPSRLPELSCRQSSPSVDAQPVWVTPSDVASRDRLARWCATVGPVFFHSQPAPSRAAPIDRLAIVSWNIHEGGGDVEQLVRRLRRGDFTGGEPVDHFVLLLQEATRRDGAVPRRVPRGYPAPRRIDTPRGSPDADIRRLAEAGLSVLYAPSMRNGEQGEHAEDRGNAIVATLPLIAPRLIELPLERQRRVAVSAAVEGRSSGGARWRLDLVDVHLDTALALLHGGPFAARRRQAAALLAVLGADAPPPPGEAAMVLAGDLNTWRGRGEPAVRMLSRAFPDTPAADRSPTWTGPLGIHAVLDYIFVRGPQSSAPVTRLPGRFGSDHFPLLTIVRFD